MRALFLTRSYLVLSSLLCIFAAWNLHCTAPSSRETQTSMKVHVDASDAARGIFHAEIEISCSPGVVTLVYPKWIPGEHAPFGPIMQVVGVNFTALGKPASWQRDPDDMFTFHCTVPENASVLNVSLDYLSPSATTGPGYGYSPNSTGRLLMLLWNHLLLYPESESTDNVQCQPSMRLPQGWKFATALPVQAQNRDTVTFQATSLTRLVDSPVMAGEYMRSIPLSEEKETPIFLDLFGDSPEAVQADSTKILLCRNVVQEADALFGGRHFKTYHFLVALSDILDFDGLEHYESTDIRLPERALLDEAIWKRRSYLIPHEYVHSWNGKYRRPLGLLSNNFQEPVQSDLLWAYEGLTRYLDVVLTGRSGLRTPEEVRDYLAWAAGYLEQDRPGRSWRSLQDAAVSVRLLYAASDEWTGWRRGWTDVYDEGALIWLEADGIIRDLTNAQHSLDDFCREFFAVKKRASAVETYTMDDITKTLDKLAHYDWQNFFNERLHSHGPDAPLGGLRRAGWELRYSDTANGYVSLREGLEHRLDATWSIGASVYEDGLVQDVIPGTPAFKAGMAPEMKVTQVNGAKWSLASLRRAIMQAKNPNAPVKLVLQQGRREVRARIDYHEGEKYPHLLRVERKKDMLEEILAPKRSEVRGQTSALRLVAPKAPLAQGSRSGHEPFSVANR